MLCRYFSSLPGLRNLSKIPSKYRPKAIREAQQALTDYLHSTRLLPFAYAEHISKNSLVSLSNLIASIDFSASDFSRSVRKFLRYHPINEFEFFYESIGIDYNEVHGFLPTKNFFFSEDGSVLSAACALAGFGFPWNKLGNLYKEESSIFSRGSEELSSRLDGFREYGFSNISVIGICLAFPYVLSGELVGEIDALFDDMKRFFLDFDMGSCVEGNVDAWYEICMKIRVFYDLGFEKGKLGDLIGKSKSIFVDYPVKVFVQKAEFFGRFGVRNEDVGLLLLQRPEIWNYDMEKPLISVKGLLKHFGFSDEEVIVIAHKYPHVLGRNKMANLPHVMRAMDLHVWFFNKIKDGNHQLIASYAMRDPDEDLDKEFSDSLERIRVSRTPTHTMYKVDFLLGIGFGENALTAKVLAHMHGTSSELQERFDCLLHLGIAFSKLCMMIRTMPKILNQKPEMLEQKVNFLCQDLGSSLQELDIFPAYLCFNLESRIKPRCRFHMWLTDKGLCTRKYSMASIVATSEKNFVARIYGIHPAALKHWFECFSY
ncbi:hypothetical protein P3X46_014595 [Hevea brasiliensis]|uniref:Uncharacterized protein n=1 Tax=Hevea brasiliensis TaxID=3981 RepID=A0ABQ9LVE9_HEVBR|nr:transcription termination factor MTEF18, mitochondrial [Hevea brasiliensis]KAJ9171200.1 hypothetical protein P3X46_014595 [Hevea brasiliensis]